MRGRIAILIASDNKNIDFSCRNLYWIGILIVIARSYLKKLSTYGKHDIEQ